MVIEKDEVTIYDVETIHKEILKEFEEGSISIDMAKVTKVDMSMIQLFVSAQKSAKKASKSFELKNVHVDVQEIFKKTACEFLLGENHG